MRLLLLSAELAGLEEHRGINPGWKQGNRCSKESKEGCSLSWQDSHITAVLDVLRMWDRKTGTLRAGYLLLFGYLGCPLFCFQLFKIFILPIN